MPKRSDAPGDRKSDHRSDTLRRSKYLIGSDRYSRRLRLSDDLTALPGRLKWAILLCVVAVQAFLGGVYFAGTFEDWQKSARPLIAPATLVFPANSEPGPGAASRQTVSGSISTLSNSQARDTPSAPPGTDNEAQHIAHTSKIATPSDLENVTPFAKPPYPVPKQAPGATEPWLVSIAMTGQLPATQPRTPSSEGAARTSSQIGTSNTAGSLDGVRQSHAGGADPSSTGVESRSKPAADALTAGPPISASNVVRVTAPTNIPPHSSAKEPSPVPTQASERAPSSTDASKGHGSDTVVAKLSAKERQAFVSRADVLLASGDITSARLLYEYGAEAGDDLAALRLGETFDPGFLSQARLGLVRGDPNKAAFWYRWARGLGNGDAYILLKSLRSAGK
jgi:hypothetical protein